MRTYAIWNARRSVLIFLVIFTLAIFAASAVSVQLFLKSLTFIQVPPSLGPLGSTCVPVPVSTHAQTYFSFVLFMMNQSVIAALALARGVHQYRRSNHPLIKTMYEDGLLYYIYLLVLCIANVVVSVAAPPQYVVLLRLPLRVGNSIGCTRVLLNIRGAYFNLKDESDAHELSNLRGGDWADRADARWQAYVPSESNTERDGLAAVG